MSEVLELAIAFAVPVAVYCFEEFLKILCITPFKEYRKLKGDISYSLTYYANMYNNVIDLADNNSDRIKEYNSASEKTRDLASRLYVCAETREFYNFRIPQKRKLIEAANCLIGISNNMFCPYNTHDGSAANEANRRSEQKIRETLSIPKL